MATRECYHCKRQIDEGDAHDCWTTTESALTRELSEDLLDAWRRLRETAAAVYEWSAVPRAEAVRKIAAKKVTRS